MALVYLRHPLHGEKTESNDMISAMDKANGWVEFNPIANPVEVEQVKPEPVKVEKPKPVKVDTTVAVPDFLKAPKP